MAGYTQYTLQSLTAEISNLLADPNNKYWTTTEIQYAVQEAMYVWGALTSYWRASGTFTTSPNVAYYDMSVQLPTLRPRTITLGQLTADIQYALLEAANGISGAGMSGQTTVTAILNSINRARNRFVLDAVLPFSVTATTVNPPPTDGIVTFADSIAYVHRAAWQDTASGNWYPLWRQDNYSADAGLYQWLATPELPRCFTEDISPLDLQLIPPPAAAGVLETITVDTIMLDLTSAATTFNVPDEWAHAIKWGALSDLYSVESMLADTTRGKYAEMRYQQAVDFAKNSKSVTRLIYNNTPLMPDTLFAVDAGQPQWRNMQGPPQTAGVLFDFVTIIPGSPQAAYTISASVVQAAPVPILQTDDIQVGPEDINHLIDYVIHILTFKCGGHEFESTFARYNDFMTEVSFRNQILKAKIQYLKPTLELAGQEEGERPDVWNLQSTKGGGK